MPKIYRQFKQLRSPPITKKSVTRSIFRVLTRILKTGFIESISGKLESKLKSRSLIKKTWSFSRNMKMFALFQNTFENYDTIPSVNSDVLIFIKKIE